MNVLLPRLTLLAALLVSMVPTATSAEDFPAAQADPAAYNAQWHAGKAEITRYTLEQARYGNINPGEATLIFVTEDLLRDQQIKTDYNTDEPHIPVLKLNALRNFTTGIYTYSLMTSVFTPVDFLTMPHTLKVTTSIQDWCGQTWTQMNLRNGKYKIEQRSYFQVEGDEDTVIPAAFLEDEVWTRLRVAPSSLPVGNEVMMVPARIYTRFYKKPDIAESAKAALETVASSAYSSEPHAVYTVDYKDNPRKLSIYFQAQFPYAILGWEETGAAGDAELVTRAKRASTMMLDYWSKHDPADLPLRVEMGYQKQN